MQLSIEAENALTALESWYKLQRSAVVALSGGVDSSLVCYLTMKFLGPENTLAVISDSPSLKRKDFAMAKEFCHSHKIPYHVINTQELIDKRYNENPINRCYFCKTHLYVDLNEVRQSQGMEKILNGHNLDDRGDYRPGMQAADENGVLSPLDECGISKAIVRELAVHPSSDQTLRENWSEHHRWADRVDCGD